MTWSLQITFFLKLNPLFSKKGELGNQTFNTDTDLLTQNEIYKDYFSLEVTAKNINSYILFFFSII